MKNKIIKWISHGKVLLTGSYLIIDKNNYGAVLVLNPEIRSII